MKKLISYLSMALLVVLASCSGGDKEEEKFNAVETQALITQYDANGGTLTSEEYSVLIKNTHLLFADIKQHMKELLDKLVSHGGKGGGSSEMIQGFISCKQEEIKTLID